MGLHDQFLRDEYYYAEFNLILLSVRVVLKIHYNKTLVRIRNLHIIFEIGCLQYKICSKINLNTEFLFGKLFSLN